MNNGWKICAAILGIYLGLVVLIAVFAGLLTKVGSYGQPE